MSGRTIAGLRAVTVDHLALEVVRIFLLGARFMSKKKKKTTKKVSTFVRYHSSCV